MTTRSRWAELAVLLPIIGVVALVVRAELALRSGRAFLIEITGYDPRDLLRGHYLEYEHAFDWQGSSTCGKLWDGRPVALSPSCCVCLTRVPDEALASPLARQVPCEDVRGCDGWLDGGSLVPPLFYFVPERRAPQLEVALRGRRAAVEVTCGPGGQPALGDLYLDGQPWRELIDK